MKQLTCAIVVSILLMSCAGRSKPWFYQTGKSIEHCQFDIVECIREAERYGDTRYNGTLLSAGTRTRDGLQAPALTDLCMKARGYQHVYEAGLPQGVERVRVIAPFAEYWIAGGAATTSGGQTILAAQEPGDSDGSAAARKPTGYRAELDPETGRITTYPVYEDEQPVAGSVALGGN